MDTFFSSWRNWGSTWTGGRWWPIKFSSPLLWLASSCAFLHVSWLDLHILSCLKAWGKESMVVSNRFVLQIVNRYWEGSKSFCLSYFDFLLWQNQIVHFSPMLGCTSHQKLISIWCAQFKPHDKHGLRVKNFIAGLNLCVQFGCNCTYCCTFPSSVIRMTKFLELKFFSFLCPTLWLWTLAVDDSREFIVLCDHQILASDSFATTFLITLYLTKNSCPLQINFHEFAQSVIPNHLKKRTLPTYNTSPNDHFLS